MSKKTQKRQQRRRQIATAPADNDLFLLSYKWREVRMQVLIKYGARCQCCGASAKTGAVICVDHIKSRKTHPELALDFNNLQVLCDACNHGKGNWDSTDWRPDDGVQYDPLDEAKEILKSF